MLLAPGVYSPYELGISYAVGEALGIAWGIFGAVATCSGLVGLIGAIGFIGEAPSAAIAASRIALAFAIAFLRAAIAALLASAVVAEAMATFESDIALSTLILKVRLIF